MKRVMVLMFILSLVLQVACTKEKVVTTSPKSPILTKVGLYLPPYDDYFADFNKLALKGIAKIEKEYKVQVEVVKAPNVNEIVYADKLAQDKDAVVFMSFPLNSAYSELTVRYPEKYFIGIETYIDGVEYDEPDNGSGIFARDEQGGFLAGILAGILTSDKSLPGLNTEKKVGFIGAVHSPFLNRDLGGFQQGAWYIDKTISVYDVWGKENNPKMFNDPEWAYKEAKKLYLQKGVDIIFTVGGKTTHGVYKAAYETGKYAIGMDSYKGYLAPGHVIAGINRNIDVMVYKELKDYLEQKQEKEKGIIKNIQFHAGSYKYGIPEGVIDTNDMIGMDEEQVWLKEGKLDQAGFDAIKAMKAKLPGSIFDKIAEVNDKISTAKLEVSEASGQQYKVEETKSEGPIDENELIE